MKKKLGLLLATVMVANIICSTTVSAASLLSKYNLYNDVMGNNNQAQNDDRERVGSDFYANSLANKNATAASKEEATQIEEVESRIENQADRLDDIIRSVDTNNLVGPRNQDLRESSRRVYSDAESDDPWVKEISFYPQPSLSSIRAKYRGSNFAGALQESISLVNNTAFYRGSREQKTMAYYYLAMCYAKCGQKENAIRAYEKVIALNDSPMIVKYATNGRNCVMKGDTEETCYPQVNVPEFVYPNTDIADSVDLTPIDPNTLVQRNMKRLQKNTVPQTTEGQEGEVPLNLPFGTQDAALDKFINAPYGNGLSPEFNQEYKQIQLRTIQKKMNAGVKTPESQQKEEVKQDSDKSSDAGLAKLAYDSEAFEKIQKDPEYIRQKQELDELNKLFGSSSNKSDDITDLLPYATEQGDKKLSPEVIQTLMMQSLMSDLTL